MRGRPAVSVKIQLITEMDSGEIRNRCVLIWTCIHPFYHLLQTGMIKMIIQYFCKRVFVLPGIAR